MTLETVDAITPEQIRDLHELYQNEWWSNLQEVGIHRGSRQGDLYAERFTGMSLFFEICHLKSEILDLKFEM